MGSTHLFRCFRRIKGKPSIRHRYFDDFLDTGINSGVVHVDNLLAFSAIGLEDGFLHVLHSVIDGDDTRNLKEGSLQNCVRSRSKTKLEGNINSIDGVEVDMLFSKIMLHLVGKTVGNFLGRPFTVQQQAGPILEVLDHIESVDIGLVMDTDKIGFLDIVLAADRGFAKAQVGPGQAAGFFPVIFEISLDVEVRVVTDDLNCILVGANRSVGANAPELAAHRSFRHNIDFIPIRERMMGHIINDTDGVMVLRNFRFHVAIHGSHHGRRRILAG